MRYLCPRPGCGTEFDANIGVCSVCAFAPLVPAPVARMGRPYGPGGVLPRERRRPATTDLATLEARYVRPRLVPYGYDALRLPLTTSVAVEGPPGAGKSTFSTVAAIALAHGGHPVLYLSVEEGCGPTAVDRCRRARELLGVPAPRQFLVADVATPDEALAEIEAFRTARGEGLVVVDSLTELHAADGFVADLIADDRLGCLLVLHLTTGGVPRGGLEPVYAADVWIHVDRLRAEIRKSRWGAGSTFPVLEPLRVAPGEERVIELTPPRGAR